MPDIRSDPVTGHQVIIAPGRDLRSSDFRLQTPGAEPPERCPFCPGHESETPPEICVRRPSGAAGTTGWSIRVVPNKYPAIAVEDGAHEVIIESADHNASVGAMSVEDLTGVVETLQQRISTLQARPEIDSVLIFKNHGSAAGATRQHPHSQLVGLPVRPPRLRHEWRASAGYHQRTGCCFWCEAIVEAGDRLVLQNEHYVVLAPYAARVPGEIWILPCRHCTHLHQAIALPSLAAALRSAIRRLNRVFGDPPYNLTWLTAPVQEAGTPHYHWRIEAFPRRGILAGFEWGSGCFVNSLAPEEAAARLREADSD